MYYIWKDALVITEHLLRSYHKRAFHCGFAVPVEPRSLSGQDNHGYVSMHNGSIYNTYPLQRLSW